MGLLVILVFVCYFFRIYLGYVLQIAKLKQYSGAIEINMVYPMASGVVGLGLIIFHGVSLLLMPIETQRKSNTDGGEVSA